MKKSYVNYFAALLMMGISLSVHAQDCSTGRYTSEVFPNFSVSSDIVYGNNVDKDGNSEDLLADIYTPDGDTETDRPLLIVAHGGSFQGGSKTGTDVIPICEAFVKRGYVVASISYRLGVVDGFNTPTDADAGAAVMRATQDARAAVRFFRNSVINDNNPYGINEAKIMMCGVSAGGFMATHLAYLDELSEVPSYIDLSETGLSGGIEGDSGTPGINSEVTAIVNIAGALGDTSWIESTDAPILSFHGDADGTVPYDTDVINFLGVIPLMEVDGSSSIHLRTDNIGLYNCFKAHFGADHVPHTSSAAYLDTTINYMERFLADYACDNNPMEFDCEYQFSSTEELSREVHVDIYPNPSHNVINIEAGDQIETIRLVDVRGKEVDQLQVASSNFAKVDVSQLENGVYLVEITTLNSSTTKRIIIE